MTSELTLLALRFGFLAVLWLFVFAIVFALRSDLFGQRARKLPTDQQPGRASSAAAAPPAPVAEPKAATPSGKPAKPGKAAPAAPPAGLDD